MPKSYEDEIRDILKGMDRFPGEQRAPRRRRFAWPSLGSLGQLDARRIMGGALILMLFAWVLRGPWGGSFPLMTVMAGYISLASIVLFVVALVTMIRGGALGGPSPMYREKRWRGQVINMPRRGGLFWTWRRNLARFFGRFTGGSRPPSGGPRPTRPGGRDSFQW